MQWGYGTVRITGMGLESSALAETFSFYQLRYHQKTWKAPMHSQTQDEGGNIGVGAVLVIEFVYPRIRC